MVFEPSDTPQYTGEMENCMPWKKKIEKIERKLHAYRVVPVRYQFVFHS